MCKTLVGFVCVLVLYVQFRLSRERGGMAPRLLMFNNLDAPMLQDFLSQLLPSTQTKAHAPMSLLNALYVI
jgi:hypothetical protein